jgi:hypothetical protein
MLSDGELEGSVLGVHLDEGALAGLGQVAESLVAFSGTGIATSPFTAISTLSLTGAEDADWDDDLFSGVPIGLSNQQVGALDDDDEFEGCAIDAALSASGWVTPAGQDGATALAGSGTLSATVEAVGSGAGLDAVPFNE